MGSPPPQRVVCRFVDEKGTGELVCCEQPQSSAQRMCLGRVNSESGVECGTETGFKGGNSGLMVENEAPATGCSDCYA